MFNWQLQLCVGLIFGVELKCSTSSRSSISSKMQCHFWHVTAILFHVFDAQPGLPPLVVDLVRRLLKRERSESSESGESGESGESSVRLRQAASGCVPMCADVCRCVTCLRSLEVIGGEIIIWPLLPFHCKEPSHRLPLDQVLRLWQPKLAITS